MQNTERWMPSKYVQRGGRLRATRDRGELGVGSRLIADLVAERYARYLPRYARGRLVDLGCGKVPLYAAYRPLVDTVTCVDWPQSAHGGLHVDIEADLAQSLPLADSSFDTVVLSDVLEHVPQPELLWYEMARLLAPGGHALVNVPFLYGLHEVPHDYGRYTEFALRRFAAQAGLQVALLEPVGGSLDVWADMLAKHLVRLPLLGTALAALLQVTVRGFDATTAGRCLARRSGQRFPLGYFMVAARAAKAGGP